MFSLSQILWYSATYYEYINIQEKIKMDYIYGYISNECEEKQINVINKMLHERSEIYEIRESRSLS